jgi:hypothetical protein
MARVLLSDDDQSGLDGIQPERLFSALMNEEARAFALHRGMTEVLITPFEMERLRAAIRLCLEPEPQ